MSEPSVLPDQILTSDRSPAADLGSATTQHATIKPARTDAVGCPGCGKLLAFNAASAGQVVVCPSCQRRIRMPTAAEMQAGPGFGSGSGTQQSSATSSSQSPTSRESTAYSRQPAQSSSWRSEGPYSAPKQTPFDSNASRSNANYTTPGAFLLGVSALNLAYDLVWCGLIAVGAIQDKLDADAAIGFAMFFVWALMSIVCHAMTLVAGWKMTQHQSLSTARLGAIVGFIPCGVCFLVQVPFAIWAVVVLYSAEAPTDFESRGN